jgi:cyclopropane fatty-acyl-phospholipid synthase-like methyltransferase
MPAANDPPEIARFSSVDTVADPDALVKFLEVQEMMPGLVSARAALLDQLRLEQARHALDVGCGLGSALIEMARRLPPGGKAAGVDISQTMIDQARSRASGLGLDIRFETGTQRACRSMTRASTLAGPKECSCVFQIRTARSRR